MRGPAGSDDPAKHLRRDASRPGGIPCAGVKAALLSWLLLCSAAAGAQPAGGPWFDAQERRVTLWFFWSETCPHCQEARRFIEPEAGRHPWLRLESRNLSADSDAPRLFRELAGRTDLEAVAVPAFFWCGTALVGFDDADGTGRLLIGELAACYADVFGENPPGFTAEPVPDRELRLPGGLDADSVSLPVLTLVLGGLDAFNPCAFFILLFLLSMLVHTRSRGRMLLVGGVFLTVSGVVYFLFMAAWLNLFLLVGHLRAITIAAGLVALFVAFVNIKDWFWFKRGLSLTLSDRQTSSLIARMRGLLTVDGLPLLLAGTVTLAVLANLYELLCTAGFPLAYTRVLTLHGLSTGEYYLWLLLYNLVYVTPLLLITAAFVFTLGARKLSEREGRALKLLSGLMMLGIGVLLLAAPELLARIATAGMLLVGALLVTFLVMRFDRS
jgi:hypothetical protein